MNQIILAAGGTGGHVFPALSVGEALLQKGYSVAYITDQRGQQYFPSSLKKSVLFFHWGSGFSNRLLFLLSLSKHFLKYFLYFLIKRPSLVVGFGGYPSLSCLLAAQCLFIPTVIHEQNAVIGKTNRLLSYLAKKVLLGFPPQQSVKKGIVVGNPVRSDILRLQDHVYQRPKDAFRLLVIGGSQGAKIFSTVLPEALAHMPSALLNKLEIVQQVRPEFQEVTHKIYQEKGIKATLYPFIENIATELEKAHFVIARSGASTVSELMVAGKPSLLVPYSLAVQNHQFYNALYLKNQEAAWVLTEKEFIKENILSLFIFLLQNPQELFEKSKKIKSLAYPKASQVLADEVLDLLRL